MDRIKKLLAKLSSADRDRIEQAVETILSGDWKHLDIKKLGGGSGLRVRVGDFRIKFYLDRDDRIIIYSIERRNSHTY